MVPLKCKTPLIREDQGRLIGVGKRLATNPYAQFDFNAFGKLGNVVIQGRQQRHNVSVGNSHPMGGDTEIVFAKLLCRYGWCLSNEKRYDRRRASSCVLCPKLGERGLL